MKKTVLFLVVSTILFAGCTSSTQKDISLTQTPSAVNDDQKNTQLNLNNDGSLETSKATTNNQGEPMKTIADFQPITATQVTLKTTKGDITFKLFRDEAPLTTLNFLTLAKDGFYDGVVFHRVIADFMAQVGDPLSKDPSKEAEWGSGGPGYAITDEFGPNLKHDKAGMVSMANRGPNTGGSQFFITYEPTPWLDGKHAIFGEVTNGMDVLQNITVGDKIISVSYQ
jgi:peptidyl-prolyl cis-trans isomerase B (cyclophilin B)